MMRCDSFARAAGFAAGAAGGWLVWAPVAVPVIGGPTALAAYLVSVAALYVGAVAPTRRVFSAVTVGLLGLGAALCAHTVVELAIALAAIVGIAHAGVFYRSHRARATAIEIGLAIGGLLFARALAGPSLVAIALALWAYLLVQALFFLIGGVQSRDSTLRGDPFEDAYRRASALLDHSPL